MTTPTNLPDLVDLFLDDAARAAAARYAKYPDGQVTTHECARALDAVRALLPYDRRGLADAWIAVQRGTPAVPDRIVADAIRKLCSTMTVGHTLLCDHRVEVTTIDDLDPWIGRRVTLAALVDTCQPLDDDRPVPFGLRGTLAGYLPRPDDNPDHDAEIYLLAGTETLAAYRIALPAVIQPIREPTLVRAITADMRL